MEKLVMMVFAFLIIFSLCAEAKNYEITSPNQHISVTLSMTNAISYSVKYINKALILPSEISMTLQPTLEVGKNAVVSKAVRKFVNQTIIPVVREKRAEIPDIYNQLILKLKNGFELSFRVYDDGVAYQFASNLKGEITVVNEQAEFNFTPGAIAFYPQISKRSDADIFHTSFEEPYMKAEMDTIPENMLAFSPVLIQQEGLPKVLITDSDIKDYPGMFLTKGKSDGFKGKFAPYPLKEIVSVGDFKQKLVVERADYIAKTKGTRTFPWRVMVIAPTDGDLLVNDLVYRLAPAPDFTDFTWIKPGKSTEEWITALNLYGVDFNAGLNTATYKYYIDFAVKFGFQYVMLDAGWSDVNDLFKITPGMDMEEITSYAKQKGIGLILWTQALTVERQMEQALQQFKKWDIKIVMTDFIDRDDQVAINFLHRFAGECAKNKFMCMIHGAPKPAGFSRTWPNMLTREATLGSEYNVWSFKANPDHDLMLPFIRMVSGPMDYEPGILQHATKALKAKMGFEKVIAQGTRMHQIAMFVVYDSPLQLFSGNLSDAYREPELMRFLGTFPTVWDETRIIEAQLGNYIVEVRRKGNDWYIADMNAWQPHDCAVSLDFLNQGNYQVETGADGINAEKNPQDFYLKKSEVTSKDKINIHLAPGGGFVARIIKKSN